MGDIMNFSAGASCVGCFGGLYAPGLVGVAPQKVVRSGYHAQSSNMRNSLLRCEPSQTGAYMKKHIVSRERMQIADPMRLVGLLCATRFFYLASFIDT